ncbi:MAG TPA: transglutaminase domain-containing protein, partial [bacterium]|nr:transglutaminase domain-containing protein [bacterium]
MDPQDLADIIENMNDGDVDDLDLSQFSQALLALLFGAAGLIEKFRIYDYNSINEMIDTLWRYEVFDEYTGDQWISNANSLPFNFISDSDYYDQYGSQDRMQIKMPLSTNIGTNLIGLPILFPTPFIIEGFVDAPNLVPDSETLTKDDFNSTAVNLEFTSADSVNMTFELFGLDLPSEQDIYSSAVLVSAPPTAKYTNIINQFTQLPPDFNSYYTSQPNFQTHYDALNLTIDNTDNAFVVANKTRNYLLSQFTFPTTPDEYQSAPEGRDTVDWFLEQGMGVFSDFASAFCVFTRAFGVASRFVDGFRSLDVFGQVEEITYPTEPEKNTLIIRYKNIYNWAEIYVPTDIDGDGMWAQFDVSSGAGGISLPKAFNMTVNSNFTAGPRGQVANLTAVLTTSANQSVEDKEIIFTDYTYGVDLGNATTDINGTASILIDIDNSQVVGPHVIVAQYGLSFNWTMYTVYGDIDVNLTSVNPTMINRSISNSTIIQGYVNDPVANQRVKNATVELVLLDKGTNNKIGFPFDTFSANADNSGNFIEFVNVNPWVPRGNYEIRVDFNGSWGGLPFAFGIMNDSSNRIGFNVTEPLTFTLLFSINGQPTDYPNSPNPGNLINVKRGEQLNLSVTLIDESDMSLASGEIIEFYDYTNGDVIIGTDITDSFGSASILYDIGNTNKSGPTLVYAKFGADINYSYYIVNESIWINVISFSDPLEYDLAAPFPFNIQCDLIDSFANPIYYSCLLYTS